MFAGVQGRGAQDAWHTTALEMEEAFVNGERLMGEAVDIYKCFDQISRPVVYKIVAMAGMPSQVLDAYKMYQESLTVRNSVSGGLGVQYTKKANVPQGDHFSMMIVALIMKPWILEMRRLGARGRILADDIFVAATGIRHRELFIAGYQETHEYLERMGAKMAPSKSYVFSPEPATMRALREMWWPGMRAHVDVIHHTRDLGQILTP